MHVLSATGLTKIVDDRVLFRDVALGIATGDRIGLVGPNGSGKSTLLGILAGTVSADGGEVVHATEARISTLAQDPTLVDGTALAAALALCGDDAVRGHEAAAMLDRLGVAPTDPTASMSGGQRRRVALAATLLPPSHLLVLDEPTNHLDVWTVDWLEDELRRRASALLLVTHDRRMLERLTTRLLELDPGGVDPTGRDGPGAASAGAGVYWHDGGYSTMLEAREERARRRGRAQQQRANLLRKEIAWLRRQPKARTSKPRFRMEQAQALQAATPPGEQGQLQLGTGRRRLGSKVVDATDVTFRYAEDGPTIVDHLSLAVGPGQRLGVVGPNGAGKTTLLGLLTGELAPTTGTVEHGTTVEIGIYRQRASVPSTDVSVIDTIHEVGTRIPLASGETLPARRLAERFGFGSTLQRASVATLSGGERRRLALLHMLVAAPNVIVLDEPTNDLDLDTLATLEDHLDGFRGTLLVASHDRFVLDRLTDELLAVGVGGTVTRHLDWSAYREHADPGIGTSSPTSTRDGRTAGADVERTASQSPASSAHDRRREGRRRLRRAEAAIGRLTTLRDELDVALAHHGSDAARVAELATARARVVEQLDAAEDEWLAVGEELEAPVEPG